MAPHGLQEVQVASDNVMDRNSMDGINISGSSSGSTSTGSDQVMDEHVERFAAQCMSQLLPRYHDYSQVRNTNNAREMSSLDLELGEDDYHDPWELDQAAQEAAQEEELIDQEEAGYEDDDIASAMDELVNDNDTNTNNPTQFAFQKRKASGLDLLLEFDPENPPPSDDPEALQLWLECDAQQEAVFKYQKVIDSARDRKDYSSLSMVQRQVLRWFQPLKEEIATRQKNYIMKEGASNATAAKRYGPYLCALPPEKLAVIVAHEAIMHALLKSGVEGRGGVPFVSMAKRIGEAVEEEVLIHRLLHKRFLAGQLRMREDEDTEMFDQSGDTAEEGPAIVKESLVSDRPTTQVGDRNSTIGELTKELDPVASTHKWAYAPSHLRNYMEEISQYEPNAKKRRVVSYAIRRARQILEKEEEWSVQEKVQLGAALFQALLDKATIVQDGKEEMAFTYEKRWFQKNKIRSYVSLNEGLYKMVVSDKLHSFGATTTKHKPMILPPKPWTDPNDGGYLWLKVDLIRYHGCNTQKEALQNADLSTVFDGLNALGRVPWQINKRILEVANHCWENSIALGDIPARTDFEVPPEPIQPERPAIKLEKDHPGYKESVAEYRAYREALSKCRRLQQKNMVRCVETTVERNVFLRQVDMDPYPFCCFFSSIQDLRSLRCSAMLKLDQAEKFQNFEQIYFPYNMDFRGRAYPVPPHLSNVGSDLCRGMLKFAEAKPLGPRGLYWLKVHLANFAGKDKMSFDERAKFVDEHIDEIRASAADPFAGDMWWMTLEDPFQGLATCIEIVNALDSGDPESFMCSLPVHMDGSCNGLQHYAALGRDLVGGKAVNLCSMEEPQDVYVGVMHEVIKRVSEEAERKLDFDVSDIDSLSRKQKKEYKDNRAAQLVNGLIDRGVVKRTVMTSVYGVTYIGARQQIQEKIESKVCAKLGVCSFCFFFFKYQSLTVLSLNSLGTVGSSGSRH
jgi:DNA-directed RNA polymerase